jgi:hypothetical protein
VANREVFVFRHGAPTAGYREPPNLSVVGIPQPDVATRHRFFTERRQNRASDGGNWASTRNRMSSA